MESSPAAPSVRFKPTLWVHYLAISRQFRRALAIWPLVVYEKWLVVSVTKEGVPALVYHGVGAGTCVAFAEDPNDPYLPQRIYMCQTHTSIAPVLGLIYGL